MAIYRPANILNSTPKSQHWALQWRLTLRQFRGRQ
jgi:hypothetical protein